MIFWSQNHLPERGCSSSKLGGRVQDHTGAASPRSQGLGPLGAWCLWPREGVANHSVSFLPPPDPWQSGWRRKESIWVASPLHLRSAALKGPVSLHYRRRGLAEPGAKSQRLGTVGTESESLEGRARIMCALPGALAFLHSQPLFSDIGRKENMAVWTAYPMSGIGHGTQAFRNH